jgi:hypothetical protein
MQAAPTRSQPERLPEFLTENDHIVTVRKCEIRRQRLLPVGDAQDLNIKEAVALLAPSKTHLARTNVLRIKTGQYVGVKSDSSNFVIVNPTNDGDIRWLLRKHPDLPLFTREVYLVESVTIRRNAIDLKSDGEAGDPR